MSEISLVTIIAALATGSLSALSFIVTKEQKTSEFRQAWIDSLRAEIAALISHVNAIHGFLFANRDKGEQDMKELWKVSREDYWGANNAIVKIALRLNPKEDECIDVGIPVKKLQELFSPEKNPPSYKEVEKLEFELTEKASILLKNEWERVKRGECIYRIAKWTAITISLAFIVFSIIQFALSINAG